MMTFKHDKISTKLLSLVLLTKATECVYCSYVKKKWSAEEVVKAKRNDII